jgi:hypothetical protein
MYQGSCEHATETLLPRGAEENHENMSGLSISGPKSELGSLKDEGRPGHPRCPFLRRHQLLRDGWRGLFGNNK